MPLFDFICLDCDREFEVLLMGQEKPLCPLCGGRNLKKRMSTFAHRSGGSGATSGGASNGGGSGCSGCAGGNCSHCH